MKVIRLLFSIIVFAWTSGFFYFSYHINNYVLENRTITDAIVVFGGTKQRLYTGVQLLKFGYSPVIFITGHKPASEYHNFMIQQRLVPEQFIFDPGLASNNRNYAYDTFLFMEKYDLDSIRLVAPAEQMPRALNELQDYLPPRTVIIPHPVSKKHDNYSSIFVEYNKYLVVTIAALFDMNYKLNLSYTQNK